MASHNVAWSLTPGLGAYATFTAPRGTVTLRVEQRGLDTFLGWVGTREVKARETATTMEQAMAYCEEAAGKDPLLGG